MKKIINRDRVAKEILRALNGTGQTASDLADAAGLSQQTVSALLNYRRRTVEMKTLLALEETIGLAIEDVVEGHERPPLAA